jgi:uncharacterized membrane protein
MTAVDERESSRLSIAAPVGLGAAGAVVAVANVILASGAYVAFLTPLVGFAAVVGVPVFLLYRADVGSWSDPGERLVASVALALLSLLVTGLVVNTVGPHLGIDRPLGSASVIVAVDVLCALLGLLSWIRNPDPLVLRWRSIGADAALAAGAALTVPLAAMGATRLNNGAGGGLSTVAIGCVAVALLVLWVRRDAVPQRVILFVLYASALALLFSTSLRGWYTTGHDVQHEMSVFLATKHAGRWATRGHDAYAACLSITILPTMVSRWTRVFDPYIYKVFFQLLYALVPLIVYRLAARWTSTATALLSAIYFMGFVGFVQDMPMLNRQEVGFLFFGVALLAVMRDEGTMRDRRTLFMVFAVGMVLSHYSTTYFAVAAFGLTWLLRVVHTVIRRWREQGRFEGRAGILDLVPRRGFAISIWLVAALAALSLAWTGPVTHSGPGLGRVVHRALHVSLFGENAQRSSDTSYAILPFSKGVTERDALDSFLKDADAVRRRDPAAHFPDAVVPAKARLAPSELLPPSAIGRRLEDVGVPVHGTNQGIRLACAFGLQLLIGVGVLMAVLRRRLASDVEVVLLGVAMAGLVVLQVVLPSVSLDYGLGRSFMQSLVVLAPLVVIGSRGILWGRLARWAEGVAVSLAMVYFLSSTGFLPQVLGGYGAQLNLNNSGDYYDVFFLHEQEVASMEWTKSNLLQLVHPYPDLQMDLPLVSTSLSVGGMFPSVGIHPAIVRRGSVVLLGYLNVVRHQGEVRSKGLDVRYQLDPRFFDEVKDRLFDDGSSRVYR